MRLICFAVPDDGQEYVPVPKVATDAMWMAGMERIADDGSTSSVYAAMTAAAPQCRVVELPEYQNENKPKPLSDFERGWVRGANWYRLEIERRAKGNEN